MKTLIASTSWTGHVTILRDSKFFFTQYHAGKVNITLHLVSISFLFYGLTVKSVPPGCLFSMRWGMPTITSLCMIGTLDSVSE